MRPLSLVSNHTRFAATARIYVHFGPFNIAPWVADVICWEFRGGPFRCPVLSCLFVYLAAVPIFLSALLSTPARSVLRFVKIDRVGSIQDVTSM